jgi:hypothetical protein
MRDRTFLVLELIRNPKTATDIVQELACHGHECEQHLAEVSKLDVLATLKQFDHGRLSALEVETWARCLLDRLDVAFEFGEEGVVDEAVFWLANPALHWPIDKEIHHRIATLFERRSAKRG